MCRIGTNIWDNLGVDVVKWVKIRDGNFGWVRVLIDSLRIAALDEVMLF